jgi:monomeric isocitrate dehydrogenase
MQKMHQDFANREDEHIYLLDYHTQVDRVYGYDSTIEEPFAEYDGTLTDDESLIKTDYIHLGQDGISVYGYYSRAKIMTLEMYFL